MSKFLALPLIQQILIVGIVAAICAGAGYYFMILPIKQSTARENVKYRNTMKEYADLKTYDTPEFITNLEKEKAEYAKLKAAYEKMLPTSKQDPELIESIKKQAMQAQSFFGPTDRVPELIESIKKQADDSGLKMTIIDAEKTSEEGPGYRGIAFDVEMVGTYHEAVAFLSGLAGTSKRIINAKDLKVAPGPSDQLQKSAGDVGLLRVLMEREAARGGLTPNEKYAKSVLLFDDIARRRLMKVNFTAVAYVYTGAGAPAAQ